MKTLTPGLLLCCKPHSSRTAEMPFLLVGPSTARPQGCRSKIMAGGFLRLRFRFGSNETSYRSTPSLPWVSHKSPLYTYTKILRHRWFEGKYTCCTILVGVDVCNIGSGQHAKRRQRLMLSTANGWIPDTDDSLGGSVDGQSFGVKTETLGLTIQPA